MYREWESEYEFFDNYLLYTTWDRVPSHKDVAVRREYRLDYEHGVPFLTIDGDVENRKLVLFNDDIMYWFDSDGELCYRAISAGIMKLEFLSTPYEVVHASSFLSEVAVAYKASNLEDLDLNPWVEGVPGPGIGEWIEFPKTTAPGSIRIHFMNGFISYSNPSLYRKNSRIKKIRVWQNGESSDVGIPNSPHPFPIAINPDYPVKLEILEVYPGTVWQDTSISYLLLSGW